MNVWEIHAGNTLLIEAAKYEHREACEYLLSKGADASIKNRDGLTAADICKDDVMKVHDQLYSDYMHTNTRQLTQITLFIY